MISDYIIQILHETHKCKWTFFVQIIFYKNRILAKKNFLLNHTSWVYFLDYMSLPYHFGKLWMSTFNCFQWYFTKAKRIHVIPTNTRELFFESDLNNVTYLVLDAMCICQASLPIKRPVHLTTGFLFWNKLWQYFFSVL